MKLSTAVAVLLASAAIAATPAVAQQAAKEQIQPKVSREAVKSIQALQTAAQGTDAADVTAKVAAANAAAKSADDKYMIAALEYKFAAAQKDDSLRAQAIEQMIASGFKGAPMADLYGDLGATYSRMKQDQRAADAYQHALQLDPNNVDAVAGIAEAKVAAGQTAEGIALLQKGIALQSAGGAKAPEAWYKRALAIAYKAKLPQAMQLSRDWLQAYPSPTGWHDALAVYQNVAPLDETQTLDLMRLKRVTGALGPGDYFNYGDIAVRKGYPGEAKAILDEGFAANAIKKTDPSFSQLYTLASQKAQGDKASLKAAPAASATAAQMLNEGDAWYGYGDYAKAAVFYQAALAKSGADANRVNLHLGMALARQGDKAGATAALNKVTGSGAELAKYWLLYVNRAA
jgi:tetratricopeptide (TPR) repeat protein